MVMQTKTHPEDLLYGGTKNHLPTPELNAELCPGGDRPACVLFCRLAVLPDPAILEVPKQASSRSSKQGRGGCAG